MRAPWRKPGVGFGGIARNHDIPLIRVGGTPGAPPFVFDFPQLIQQAGALSSHPSDKQPKSTPGSFDKLRMTEVAGNPRSPTPATTPSRWGLRVVCEGG